MSTRAAAPKIAVLAVADFFVIALVVAAKALRDALFCERFSRAELPRAMVAGAVLSGLCALLATRAFRAVGPVRGGFALLVLNALVFGLEFWLFPRSERATSLLLYLHVSAVSAVLVSGLWLAINERLDPHTLRHEVSRIGLGGTLGGVVGGAFLDSVTVQAGVRATLLALALLSCLAAVALSRLGSGVRRQEAVEDAAGAPREQRPYLGRVAWFVGLGALASSMADFAFKARAMETYGSAAELVRFFSLFYIAVNAVSFGLQSAVTPKLLDKTNLGLGLATTPAALCATSLFALALPSLPAQALLKGVDASFSVTVFRSAYEPLFTPVPVRAKRSLKALIDVVVDKLGDASGSLVCWGLVALFSGAAAACASFLVLLASLAGLVLAGALQRRYVEELARSLRAGTITLNEADAHDRTTRLTLSSTIDRMTRERVLAEIQARAAALASGSDAALRPSSPPAAPAAAEPGTEDTRELCRALEALRASDPERVLRALSAPDPALASFVIPLVQRSDVGAAAMAALAAAGSRVSGQLTDALLDRERHPPALRRRLARIVAHEPSTWAALGLFAALDDPDFGVRSEILHGLEQLRHEGIVLPIAREALVDAAARELAQEQPAGGRSGVDHALTLLGLAFDPDSFRLAARALASGDEKLSGTALEYLENVLPEPIRSRLVAALPAAEVSRSTRAPHELIAELEQRLDPLRSLWT